jgi:hypothetical protein
MKKLVVITSAGVLVLLILAAAYISTQCPCEQLPGVAIWGEDSTALIDDWTFANEAPLCQLQVNNGLLPQSINLNCMSDDGDLFISCSRCEGKRWSSLALTHANGRIKIGERVYPIVLTRLTEPAALDRSWAARKAKLESFGREVEATRPGHWWSFRLVSR